MNYLCLAVKREVAGSERGSKEQAQTYFRERFGECVKERLEGENKKLEGRIRYYDRREEKHNGEPEIKAECLRRREAAWEELKRIESQMGDGQEGIRVWNYEEKGEFPFEILDQFSTEGFVLMLRMAKVCRTGSDFQVVEETWSYMVGRETGKEGIMEVRGRLPEKIGEGCLSLDICRESQETMDQFRKKIKKMVAEARRKFL